MDAYHQSTKLRRRKHSLNTEEKNQARRIKAGHSQFTEDDNENAELDHDEEKPKRKKRLKPLPAEFIMVIKDKNKDKYGIGKALRKTACPKNAKTFQERLQNRNLTPDPPRPPRNTLKTKKNQQVYTANIRKLPKESEDEPMPKKIKSKREPRSISTNNASSFNSNQLNKSRTTFSDTFEQKSFNDSVEQKSLHKNNSQRIYINYRTVSPSLYQKKSIQSVSFHIQDQISNNAMCASEENIPQNSDYLPPVLSDLEESPSNIAEIGSNSSSQNIRTKPNSKASLLSAKKSTSSTSGFQNKYERRSRSASPVPTPQSDDEKSIASSHKKARTPSASPVSIGNLQEHPKNVESTSSVKKRKSFKKRMRPKQILLSMFRQPDKNSDESSKSQSKHKDPTPENNNESTNLKRNDKTAGKKGKDAKIVVKEKLKKDKNQKVKIDKGYNDNEKNENEKIDNEIIEKDTTEQASTSGKKTVLKSDSGHTLKSSSSTRIGESPSGKVGGGKAVHYDQKEKTSNKKDSRALKKQKAHGYMNNFLKNVWSGKDFKKSKEKFPSPITDQVRVHAFRKNFLKIVARISEREKSLQQQIDAIAPPPYPRVHGFTQPVLAVLKCGRLQEKEDEIEKEKRKIKKKLKKKAGNELETTESKTTTVKSETIIGSNEKLQTTETVTTKSKNKTGDEETKTITTITTIKSTTRIPANCPFLIDSENDKKFSKRCCCKFIKSLPPTPRETFRKNPGNPHFYPAPGFRHKWAYQLHLRRLERLEEERQRLCAEQRGIPYKGPPRQYQDFFEDTPLEERCCCDIHRGMRREITDPNSFECNKGDPHLYPTLAGFRHFFSNRESIKEADKELAELRRHCEETFPEIIPLAEKKKDDKHSCLCRGKILSEEKDKEERIKEIVEKMAAICKCLDDCDCKAALQAKEPYINEDEREVCCCSRLPPPFEDFDCNAGDPHRMPTVAAFKHAFELYIKRKERIAKRRSVYEDLLQNGTDEEIEDARLSLFKQILEDGTKREREEARASLEIETTVIVETKEPDECNCPEIQEIVVMIEDSDCEEEMYTPYATDYEVCEYECMSDNERDVWMHDCPQYPDEMEGWETEPFIEVPEDVQENEIEEEPIKLLGSTSLQTQTPSGHHILTPDPQKTTETQTPRTSHTQTENTLETQTILTTKTSESDEKNRSSKTSQSTTGSEIKLGSTASETKTHKTSAEAIQTKENTKIKEERDNSSVKSIQIRENTKVKKERDNSSVKSIQTTEHTKNKKERDNSSVKSGSSTKSSKKGCKEVRSGKSSKAHPSLSDKEKLKNDTDQTSTLEQSVEDSERSSHTDRKKSKPKTSQKKCTKLSKQDQYMLKSFQPPKYRNRPKCVCFADTKHKTQKEECDTLKKKKCDCHCHSEEKKKSQKVRPENRKSNSISDETETLSNFTETNDELIKCIRIAAEILKAKNTSEKTRRKSKCRDRDNSKACNCKLKSLPKPETYSLSGEPKSKRKCLRKSERLMEEETSISNTENWYNEQEIYYPPPEPLQPECQEYQTSYGLPDKEIFNFPPPKFSSIYQEYPQDDICPETGMIFSVQCEQDRFCSEYQPIGLQNGYMQNITEQPQLESPPSFHLIFTDEDQYDENVCSSESSSSMKCDQTNNIKSCGCNMQVERIPCRCKNQSERIPCRCKEKEQKIPCRC